MVGKDFVELTKALAFYIGNITDHSLRHFQKKKSVHSLLIAEVKYYESSHHDRNTM
jgi:hypothetical protein